MIYFTIPITAAVHRVDGTCWLKTQRAAVCSLSPEAF